MDNLLTTVLIFYAIAVTIMLGIAIYLIHKAEVKNNNLSVKCDMYYDKFIDTQRELEIYKDDYAVLKNQFEKSKLFSQNHHTVEIVRTARRMDWANGTVDIPYSLFEEEDLSEKEIDKIEKAIEFAMYDTFRHHVLPTMYFEVKIDPHNLTEQFKYAIPCLEPKEGNINLDSEHPILDKIKELDAKQRGEKRI